MTIEIRKAERFKAKLRLGLAGPSGAGKTMSALKLARGVVGPTGRICLIDTERGSGDLYADITDYDIIQINAPFKPDRYIEAIEAAEEANYDIIIIDSLSHAWTDEGGILDQADKLSKASKNSYTVWADLTPQHRALVGAMLASPKHIVATVRSKQEYSMEKDDKTGKTSVRKLGLAPVQREGMEYEFTVFMDISQDHYAKVSKDRTNMFKDEVFLIDEATGSRLSTWLAAGRENPAPQINNLKHMIVSLLVQIDPAMPVVPEIIVEAIQKYSGMPSSNDPVQLEAIIAKLRTVLAEKVLMPETKVETQAETAPEAK